MVSSDLCDGNVADCSGVCGGDSAIDECGICDGSGGSETCWDGSSACDLSDCAGPPANYPDWDSNNDGVLDNFAYFANNGSVTARVYIDGEEVGAENDMIAVYGPSYDCSATGGAWNDSSCFADGGTELRGLAKASSVPLPLGGGYGFLAMVYSNLASGETFTFKYYSFADDAIYDLSESLAWETDIIAGSLVNPFVLTVSTSTDIAIDLTSGWNWISINVEDSDMGLNNVLGTISNGIYIKGQSGYADYYAGFGWFGTGLDAIDVTQGYKLNMTGNDLLEFSGAAPNPSERPINLLSGWNWIGYLPQSALELNTALSTLTNGIYIKAQSGYADYYAGFGWFGTGLDVLNPGQAYFLNMSDSDQLVYPNGGLARAMSANSIYDKQLIESFNYRQFEFNGSITAEIDIEDVEISSSDMLVAYLDGDVRGYAQPVLFPLTNKYIFQLMVYGELEKEDGIVLEYYNANSDTYYDIVESVDFVSDMRTGNGLDPFTLNGHDSTIVPGLNIVSAYPNPFNPVTNIQYTLSDPANVQVVIYDILGRQVDMFEAGFKSYGTHSITWNAENRSSGLYYIQIISGENVQTQKVMLLK